MVCQETRGQIYSDTNAMRNRSAQCSLARPAITSSSLAASGVCSSRSFMDSLIRQWSSNHAHAFGASDGRRKKGRNRSRTSCPNIALSFEIITLGGSSVVSASQM